MVSLRYIKNAALTYMMLPSALFFLFTLKWWIGIPAVLLTVSACIFSCRRKNDSPAFAPEPAAEAAESVEMKWWMAALLSLLVMMWCVAAGQGGFVAQVWDWNGRNATLRDMVMHDWPVIYNDGSLALAYYIGHWVPPALAGRLVLALGGSADAAWQTANMALLAWTFCGVVIVLLQLFLLLRADRWWKQLLLLLLLVLFSPTKTFGELFMKYIFPMLEELTGKNNDMRWGWWMFQFSHNSELLYWVFNQTVVPWIGILLVMCERSFTRMVFIVALVLLCGPLPDVGIAFFIAFIGMAALWRRMKVTGAASGFTEVVKNVFTFENTVGLLVVAPLVYAYLSTNTRSGTFAPVWLGRDYFWERYLLFVGCEACVMLFITWRAKCVWWWATAAWLCICPLVKLGNNNDFCMRASIPAFMVLMVLMGREAATGTLCRRILSVALLTSAAVYPVEMMKQVWLSTYRSWPDIPRQDRIYSYARKLEDIQMVESLDRVAFPDALVNNHCRDPYSRLFYRYLARTPSKAEENK